MEQQPGSNLVRIGIDLKEFYYSVEWDILDVPARRNEEYYPCCAEPYSGSYTKDHEKSFNKEKIHTYMLLWNFR